MRTRWRICFVRIWSRCNGRRNKERTYLERYWALMCLNEIFGTSVLCRYVFRRSGCGKPGNSTRPAIP